MLPRGPPVKALATSSRGPHRTALRPRAAEERRAPPRPLFHCPRHDPVQQGRRRGTGREPRGPRSRCRAALVARWPGVPSCVQQSTSRDPLTPLVTLAPSSRRSSQPHRTTLQPRPGGPASRAAEGSKIAPCPFFPASQRDPVRPGRRRGPGGDLHGFRSRCHAASATGWPALPPSVAQSPRTIRKAAMGEPRDLLSWVRRPESNARPTRARWPSAAGCTGPKGKPQGSPPSPASRWDPAWATTQGGARHLETYRTVSCEAEPRGHESNIASWSFRRCVLRRPHCILAQSRANDRVPAIASSGDPGSRTNQPGPRDDATQTPIPRNRDPEAAWHRL